jgi:hypothetical protein
MATPSPSLGRIALGIALVTVVGVPLLAYVWESLNRLIAGHVEWDRLLISLPLALLLIGLWKFLGRRIEAWEGERTAAARTPRSSS